ncbi:DUF4194 domain-containing protein [Haloferula sargassicola]|uniref:DUF4194 domain-containing protein n=1 Tax=Haloferula sargassicola TaxID=490096 RepID=A0ABP9UIV5_9BACT
MSETSSDPLWPGFWPDVPAEDRAPLRSILAELLGHGTLIGDTGAGRDLFRLARDHYAAHLKDYLAPLAMDLIIDDDALLIQARPRPEACLLLGQFSKDETLVLLVLWRAWDDQRSHQAADRVILTIDDLWNQFRNTFDRIEPPQATHLEAILAKLKRHRLIRTHRPDAATQPGETLVEILPSLARTIPFDSIEAWTERKDLYQPADPENAAPETPEEDSE